MKKSSVLFFSICFFLFALYSCSIPFDTDDPRVSFVTGMKGCENIYLSTDSSEFYVSDLSGHLYRVDKNSLTDEWEIQSSLKLDDYILGITRGPDDCIYAACSSENWLDKGGRVLQIQEDNITEVSENHYYPGINGMTADNRGNIYFSTGNMDFFKPDGAIFRFAPGADGKGDIHLFLENLQSPNGLIYNETDNSLVFSETFHGVNVMQLDNGNVRFLFGKTRMVEGFDDLCIDHSGNIWVTDPPRGSIKMFHLQSGKVIRFHLEGFGIASSCRIRMEKGKEILYITEIKQSTNSKTYNGRGVLMLPLEALTEQIRLKKVSFLQ